MAEKKHRFETCYLCGGDRFFDLLNGRHYRCPLCRLDGSVLVKEGESQPVPSRLVRTIVDGIKSGD